MKHSVKIYQLKNDKLVKSKFLFIRLSWLPNGIKDVDINNYNCLYETELNDDTYTNVDDILEEVFKMFNIYLPSDFTGHSLSISDIVEIDGVKYYCDSIGFKKL